LVPFFSFFNHFFSNLQKMKHGQTPQNGEKKDQKKGETPRL
jgi:hypothetical protein